MKNSTNLNTQKGAVKTLRINFSSSADANLFDAYYSADGENATLVNFDDYWEICNGKLYSKVSTGYNSLILKDYAPLCYDVSVNYTSDGGKGYLALVSKMRRKGVTSRGVDASAYCEYGHGVFVNDKNEAVMQGDFRSMALEDERGIVKKKLDRYDKTATHTLSLRCLNDNYTMQLDGNTEIVNVGGGGIGFMGVQAVNSCGYFENLNLITLDSDGNEKDILPDDDVIRVACLGDSLTFGSGEKRYNGNDTTPGFLQKMLGDGYDVRNFGLGGRTAILGSGSCIMYASGSFSLPSAEYEMAQKYHADIIYIMLGTNDSAISDGYWTSNEETGAKLFKEGYQQVIDGLLADNPNAKIYLLTPPTFRHQELPILTEQMIESHARAFVPIIAKENGFTVIDANAVTKDLDSSHLFDLIHFDPYGYCVIAKAIYEQIAKDTTETLSLPYKEAIRLKVGEQLTLRQTSRTNPIWAVANDTIVSLNGNLLTARATGETTITAKLGNQTSSVKLIIESK